MLKVTNRTLELLEYICESDDREFSVKDLSRVFRVDKATMYRMLRVLTERGYLQQEVKAGNYRLGIKLLELGARVTAKTGLLEAASPLMEKLSQELKETVNLAVMRNREVVYIHKIESPHFLRTDLQVGAAVPAYCSAPGKAMLAWWPPEQVEAAFRTFNFVAYTDHTLSSLSSLRQELQEIKKNGYAVDREEYHPGIVCIAAPILDYRGKPLAALGVAGPAMRMKELIAAQAGSLVSRYAREISRRLGYQGT